MKRKYYFMTWMLILSVLLTSCKPRLEPGAFLVGEDLSGEDLSGVDLSNAMLRNANLSGTDLSGANLQGTSLSLADLSHANLSKANLKGANLTDANLTGANLDGTILDNAILTGTKGLTNDMLSRAASLTNAQWNSTEEIQEAVAQVCKGTGISEAAAYRQEPGIHPIVIIGRDELLTPEAWQPLSIQVTELVACIDRKQSMLLETCEYTIVNTFKSDGTRTTPDPNDPESSKYIVERYRSEIPIRLVEARTGNTIVEVSLAGTPPQSCGGFDTNPGLTNKETRFGEAPTNIDIRDWLEPYVMGIEPPIELVGHTEAVTSASFSPDGKHIITSSEDKTARLWDTHGNLIAVLDDLNFGGFMKSAKFSPDGEHIVTVSYNTTFNSNADFDAPSAFPLDLLKTSHLIGVWDTDGNFITLLGGKTARLEADNFSPDGTRIVLPDNDSVARVWDMEGNSLVTLTGHTDAVISVGYSPAGDRIVTASADGTARLWDTEGNLIAIFEKPEREIESAYFSPNGSRIVTISRKGKERLWDADGNLIAELKDDFRLYSQIDFSLDGARFVASSDGTARVYDMEGNLLTVLEETYKGYFDVVSFSPEGTYILTTHIVTRKESQQEDVQLWSAEGELLTEIKGHTAELTTVAFSPDGTLILTASKDGKARIYNLKPLLNAADMNP